VDFVNSPNPGLDLVLEKFPHAAFMIMPDTEWYLHNVESLLEFCQQELPFEERRSYLVRIISKTSNLDFGTQRLIRCDSGVRWTPQDVYFEVQDERYGQEKTQKRLLRDRDLLLKEYEDHPNDASTCFYLALTFDNLGDLENAKKYYEARVKLIGWDEEDMIARYRLASVVERILKPDGSCDWPLALDHYLKAFEMRPSRAEALVRISLYYLNHGERDLSYIFAHRACEIPYPDNDSLFVEKEVYEYTRFDVLGQCAWYAGEFEVGEQAVREALKVRHDLPHLETNLNFYLNRKKELGKIL